MTEQYAVRLQRRGSWAVVEAGDVTVVVEGGFFTREAAEAAQQAWEQDAAETCPWGCGAPVDTDGQCLAARCTGGVR